MRILLVDDESDVTTVIGEALRDRGHEVACAGSGHDAIALAAELRPDAALVDIGLPDMDGVTLAELLRGAVPGKRLHLVAFTGYIDPALQGAVQRELFDDCLLKPASLKAIEKALVAPTTPAAARAAQQPR